MRRRSFLGSLIGTSVAITAMPLNTLGAITKNTHVEKYIDFLDFDLLLCIDNWLIAGSSNISFSASMQMETIGRSIAESRIEVPGPLEVNIQANNLIEASDYPGLNKLFEKSPKLTYYIKKQDYEGFYTGTAYMTELSHTLGYDGQITIDANLIGSSNIDVGTDLPQIKGQQLIA